MKKNRWIALFLAGCLLLTLCACENADGSAQTAPSKDNSTEEQIDIQYDYRLKAGEVTEVYDITFDKPVTVTVDPSSTRDGDNDLRSDIFFDNCTFNGGLTIIGDYHAMVSLGSSCSFGGGSVVSCKEVTDGAAKKTTLEDNLIKLFVSCKGVSVKTESAMGILTDGPDIVFNGTTYSKKELTPDTDFLGVYGIYEDNTMTYIKLALSEDDSAEVLN